MEVGKDHDLIASANEAIHLKLVSKGDEVLEKSESFHPEFTHQLFGDNEAIFGYKDLEIKLYYGSSSLLTYFGFTYSQKIDPSTSDGVKADDIIQILSDVLPQGFYTNQDEYMRVLEKEESNFKPFGEIINSYSLDDQTFEIRKANVDIPGFKAYHERLRTFLIWYIETASFIDDDDEKWTFYLLYHKRKDHNAFRYDIIGYMTSYNYYAYPDKIRSRISQIIILPPYQRNGHGAKLLESYYSLAEKDDNILDITAEDPSENFISLRDFVDCRRCAKLPAYSDQNLHDGFNENMANEARKKLKIHKKEEKDLLKLQKFLKPEEYNAAIIQANSQDKVQLLNDSYKAIEESYLLIIEKLALY
ncbi:Histone acetyltransferase type B catalytic subunit [Trichoplax sp. H2]|nr:Histone acetyltransferase type B catalytic subunit [Trichoplax sp. H2]|eukprot:RDD45340.1 Histone acetyltransferase type B catalytic subunit [Trichoplax sp. H2]